MEVSSAASLTGDLHIYPFGTTNRTEVVAQQYQHLLEEHQADEILCLTRLCSEQDLTDAILSSFDTVGYPNVSTLTNFASETLQSIIPGLTQISDHERIELLAAFLNEYDWETEYLRRASNQESFQQDIGELLIEMESRDALASNGYESPVLQEVAAVGETFQAELLDKEYIDRPSLIPQATAQLQEVTALEDVPKAISQLDVILVADFEEFAETERQLLTAITDATDAHIVGVAERDSRLLSSWREAGSIDSLAAGLKTISHSPDREAVSAPAAIGAYLATNERPSADIDDGSVQILETATFRDQLATVADEIERLCRHEGYSYSDITIAYQDSSAPVEHTIRLLRRHGIPTTTIAVSQLGNDPAVKELYDLTQFCVAHSENQEESKRRDRLLDQEAATPELLTEIADAATAAAGLWYWLEATNLKGRIASDWAEIEARDQFQHVKEIIKLAEFLTEEEHLEDSWSGFLPALERAFRYSSTGLEDIETDHDDGGVPVGTIYGLKHNSSRAVFLLNVTDADYPFTPDLTALLPRRRIQKESQFPMLTPQTSSAVTDTFRPKGEAPGDPFHDYFSQVSRRLLGVGARAAEQRLYIGVPGESADSLGTYLQPSRFLTELVETFDCITSLTEDEATQIASHGSASEFVVEHVDDTLEAVRRASVGGETVDLDTYQRELATIDELLNHPEAGAVQDAIAARIDFRHGRVKRD